MSRGAGKFHETRTLARRQVSVNLDADFDARLRREAEAHGLTLAEALRVYIDAGIAAADAKIARRTALAHAFAHGLDVDEVEV